MRYQVIYQYEGQVPITRLCRTLQVSVSGYYAWRHRPKSHRRQADEQLTARIEQVSQANRCVSGSPRIHAELREQGWRCGRKRIARLMRQAGISAKRRRRRVRTTDSQHPNLVAPNQLQRDFQAVRPNEKWVGDITGVWTNQGWLYLAVV